MVQGKTDLNQSSTDFYPACYSLIGASFRTLKVDEREVFAVFNQQDKKFLKELVDSCGLKEAAVISTCNRFEILSVFDKSKEEDLSEEYRGKVLKFIEGKISRKFSDHDFYSLNNIEAIRHLFRVSSSLDSMVLGEGQILGQVKDSYEKAVQAGSVGRYLHHLFQFSFSLAKKIKNNTAIADKGVSVSYVAVRLAEQIFGSLQDACVLILGSGQTAELSAVHLKARGAKNIIVANRTLDRSFELASKIGGSAISLSEAGMYLDRADIVIGSLGNLDQPIIDAQKLKSAGRTKPIFFLDLGVPRNFPASLTELDLVYLYNIDDLSQIVDENKSIREEAAKEAEIIIDYGILQFEKWLLRVSAEPAILDFRMKVKSACESELKEYLPKGISAPERDKLMADLSHRISQKISHDITNLIARLPEGKVDQDSLLPLLFEEYLKIL